VKGSYRRVLEIPDRATKLARGSLGIGVWGFGFKVSGFGFRVSGVGFKVSGFGFRVSRVSGSE